MSVDTVFKCVCVAAANFFLRAIRHRNLTSIWSELGCLPGGTELGHPGNCDPLPISASLGTVVVVVDDGG